MSISQVHTFGTEASPLIPPFLSAFQSAASALPPPPAASAPPPAASAPQHTAVPALYVASQAPALGVAFLAQNAGLLLPGSSVPPEASSLLLRVASALPSDFFHHLLALQEYALQGLLSNWTQMEHVQGQMMYLRSKQFPPAANKKVSR